MATHVNSSCRDLSSELKGLIKYLNGFEDKKKKEG